YIADCERGIKRWNKIIQRHAIDFELKVPHRAFHRAIGQFAAIEVTPEGKIISQAEWDRRHHEWLPTAADEAYVGSLMQPVTEPRKFAGWIAPPARGIDGKPLDFGYVRLD
ncbi:MAG: benzoyl-CoA 2,3-epoxidase subunit BoxB, partial [Alphaproteobacteria bacterium]|nr:benzoyl-CoA 2,3-epoxidase subunit BoxB [Alphaproteobacteria bacterium]